MAGLIEKLDRDFVICAEGYLFEMERRGYLQAGAFVPEVVLDHPEALKQLHREFVRAGTDVVQAFTYYGHREKLRTIGKEELLEPLNRSALAIAKDVAKEFPGLDLFIAGNISNTNVYDPGDRSSFGQCERMFAEQVEWAGEEGADFIIAETLYWLGEAKLALAAIKRADMIAVVNLAIPAGGKTFDGYLPEEAAKVLSEQGADVVGLNCFRGPATTLNLLKKIRGAVSCHVSGLPIPYRTTEEHPTFFSIPDPACDCLPEGRTFPLALEPFSCNRYEMSQFAEECVANDIKFVGVCCGAAPHHIREIAIALGRNPESKRYYADMTKHFVFGSGPSFRKINTELREKF